MKVYLILIAAMLSISAHSRESRPTSLQLELDDERGSGRSEAVLLFNNSNGPIYYAAPYEAGGRTSGVLNVGEGVYVNYQRESFGVWKANERGIKRSTTDYLGSIIRAVEKNASSRERVTRPNRSEASDYTINILRSLNQAGELSEASWNCRISDVTRRGESEKYDELTVTEGNGDNFQLSLERGSFPMMEAKNLSVRKIQDTPSWASNQGRRISVLVTSGRSRRQTSSDDDLRPTRQRATYPYSGRYRTHRTEEYRITYSLTTTYRKGRLCAAQSPDDQKLFFEISASYDTSSRQTGSETQRTRTERHPTMRAYDRDLGTTTSDRRGSRDNSRFERGDRDEVRAEQSGPNSLCFDDNKALYRAVCERAD